MYSLTKKCSNILVLQQVDKRLNPAAVDTPRTKALSLEQITDIKQSPTETSKAENRVKYGLHENDNPLFSIPADLYRYSPCLSD